MKRTKSLIALAIMLVIMAFSVSAYAESVSSHYTSTAGIAGSFHRENTFSVTSSTLATLGGVDNGRVRKFIIAEYVLKLTAAILIGFVSYFLLVIVYRMLLGTWMTTDFIIAFAATAGISAFYFISGILRNSVIAEKEY